MSGKCHTCQKNEELTLSTHPGTRLTMLGELWKV